MLNGTANEYMLSGTIRRLPARLSFHNVVSFIFRTASDDSIHLSLLFMTSRSGVDTESPGLNLTRSL